MRVSSLLIPIVVACSSSEDPAATFDTTSPDGQGGGTGDVSVAEDVPLPGDTAEPPACGEVCGDAVSPAPIAPLLVLQGDAYPESVDFDPISRRFFVTNLKRGDVSAVDVQTGASTVFHAGNGDGWLTLGLDTDAERRRLWVCGVLGKTLERGELWQLDLDTGERLLTVDLTTARPGGACADFARDADGGVYVTDRQAGRIYHSALDGELRVAVEDDLLAPVVIGQNGVVLHPSQKVLISGQYLPVRLLRSDLSDPAAPVVTALELDVSFLEGGADDMVAVGDTLFVIVEDRLVEVALGGDAWSTASITTTTPLWEDGDETVGGFSGIALAEGALYASRSDVVLFGFDQPSERPFVIKHVGVP